MVQSLLLLLFPTLLLLQSVVAVASDHSISNNDSVYHVPSFTLEDLFAGHRLDELSEILESTGLLAVKMDHDYDATRHAALKQVCDCDLSRETNSDSLVFDDSSTTRTTLATATVGNVPLSLDENTCGDSRTMETLRDDVAHASSAFIVALDVLLRNHASLQLPLLQSVHGKTYSSVQSIVKASSNLEHFHVYEKDTEETTSDNVLDLHTDAGLFLTFVPGLDCSDMKGSNNSFFVSHQDETKRVVFPPSSVAVMLGAGAEHWLKTATPLKATRHAVRMRAGEKRAWYGMMHLVPRDVIVQEHPHVKTFGDLQQGSTALLQSNQPKTFANQHHHTTIGCGISSSHYNNSTRSTLAKKRTRARLQHVDGAHVCNNSTNFFCWMSCLDIPQAENKEGFINEGYSLYCLDPAVLASSGNKVSTAQEPCVEAGVVGGAMNAACMGSWQPTAPGVPAQQVNVEQQQDNGEPFCYGGTTMYMDGFQWVDTTCIIYLFSSWVLTSSGAIVGACFGTLVFGVALEGVIHKRRQLVSNMAAGWKRLGVSTLAYGLQLTMGYFLMLVVMTYSGPLFMCVVLGLMGGHVVFNAKAAMKKTSKRSETSGDSESMSLSDVPEGSTPCCQNAL